MMGNERSLPQIKDSQLHEAIKTGQDLLAKTLIMNKEHINEIDMNGMTPLFYAVGRSEELTKLLLENKANVNHRSNAYQTPLHYAEMIGNENIINLLKSYGATSSEEIYQCSLEYLYQNKEKITLKQIDVIGYCIAQMYCHIDDKDLSYYHLGRIIRKLGAISTKWKDLGYSNEERTKIFCDTIDEAYAKCKELEYNSNNILFYVVA